MSLMSGFRQGIMRDAPKRRNAFGIPYGEDDFASRTRGAIARAEWEDYLRRYAPIEDQILSMYDNPDLRKRATDFVGQSVENAFSAIPEQQNRMLRGLNISLAPEQQEQRSRELALSKALTDVEARNSTLDALEDRDYMLATGISQGRQGI